MAFKDISSRLNLNRNQIIRFSSGFLSTVRNMGNAHTSDIEQTQFVEETIKKNCVTVFSKSYCPSCRIVKKSLDQNGIHYKVVELDKRKDGDVIMSVLFKMTEKRTVPRVFVDGQCIGGSEDTQNHITNGKLFEMLDHCMKSKM